MKPKILTVGHACLDIIHMIPKIPQRNTKIDSTDIEIRIGGNAANAAAAICDLGGSADLCTVFGSESHPFTRILMVLLRERMVDTGLCGFIDNHPCPNSTIMVTPDGERAIMNWQGESIRSTVVSPQSLDGYNMVLADSYRIPMVKKIFAKASSRGIPTMLDIDSPVVDIGSMPCADHVWFSREAWRKHRIPIKDLQARFGGVVGITDGDRPVTWCDQTGKIYYHTPPHVKATNTLGAGDVFRARMALAICMGASVEDAVPMACLSACEHITGKQLTKVL